MQSAANDTSERDGGHGLRSSRPGFGSASSELDRETLKRRSHDAGKSGRTRAGSEAQVGGPIER
jgi:hypothetical protein